MNKKILFFVLAFSSIGLLTAKDTIVPRAYLDGEKVPGVKDAVFKQMAIFLPKNGLNIVYEGSPAADRIKEARHKPSPGEKILLGAAFTVLVAPALPVVGVLGGIGVAIAEGQDYVTIEYRTYVSFKDKSSSSLNIAPLSCSGQYFKNSGKLQMDKCFTNQRDAKFYSNKANIFWPKNITTFRDRNDPSRDQLWFKTKKNVLVDVVVPYTKK